VEPKKEEIVNEDSKLKHFTFVSENLVDWKEEKYGAKKKMLGKHFEQIQKPIIIEKIEEEAPLSIEIPKPKPNT